MKSIKTLIKMYTRELDDRRRKMNALQDEQERVRTRKVQLEAALIDEQKRAQEDPSLLITLPAFMESARRRIRNFAEQIGLLEVKIIEARHEIAMIFAELKKYEIYEEMKEDQAEQKEAQRLQQAMDELGLRSFTLKDADKP